MKLAIPIAGLAALAYALLAASLTTPWLARLDDAAFTLLHQRQSVWVPGAQTLGLAGNLVGSLLLAALLGLRLRAQGRSAWPGLPLLVLTGWVANGALKLISDRPRPALDALAVTFTSSFPSGHAMAATTLGLGAALLLTQRWPRRRMLWWTLGLAWLLLGGLARVVLGVHHFSDIMAGYAAATVLVAGFHILAARYHP